MDNNEYQNTRYTLHLSSANISELYATARVSPMSLTYFHYCLENGNYTLNLHFAEIVFTNEKTHNSLGKRVFDIYVQEILVAKDFYVEDYTGVAQKAVVKPISNVIISNNILGIRFYWAGKRTTRIPDRGVYGPLISAISVVSDARRLDSVTGTFSLKQIKSATNDFDCANKIGEGGFGPVYKGQLPDGTIIAVKQLSSKSKRGNQEFLNEMGMISCLQHPNLMNSWMLH
ncbi:hypothetical protein I3760_09G132100 [Carya illinoinensis]|nr:hypothetical protein I3760_09G132100 [Carya illinoinensis]